MQFYFKYSLSTKSNFNYKKVQSIDIFSANVANCGLTACTIANGAALNVS